MGSEATDLPASPSVNVPDGFGGADGVFRILVVGDSLAGGLGAGITRMAQDDPRFDVINRFNESSGLSRPEMYDWSNAIEKIVADKTYDAVVILVGVNDRQDIRNGNIRYPFKSPDWVKGYQSNVDRLLASIKAANAMTVWVSIPPMADPAFDADMRYLSDIHAKQVTANGGYFVDVRSKFLAADGRYIDRGPDETGAERKLRSRDGIGFFKQGNNRFGQLVLAEINRLAAGAIVATPVIATNVVPMKPDVPAAVAGVTEPPTLGQAGLEGEQLTFRADVVSPVVLPPVSTAQKALVAAGTSGTKALLTAKADSQAQKLFSTGTVADAPVGRFDDFTEPASQ